MNNYMRIICQRICNELKSIQLIIITKIIYIYIYVYILLNTIIFTYIHIFMYTYSHMFMTIANTNGGLFIPPGFKDKLKNQLL